MKTKLMIVLLVIFLFGIINVSAAEIKSKVVLVSLSVTLTSDIVINPNADGLEEDVITSTNMIVVNNSPISLEVYATDITSIYEDEEFISYNNSLLDWTKLGTRDTKKYVAFGMNSLDVIPNQLIYLGILDDSITINTDVKTGYAWDITEELKKTYSISLVFKAGDEDLIINPENPIFLEKPTYTETSATSVELNAEVYIPTEHTPVTYGFLYCEGEGTPNVDLISNETFTTSLDNLIPLQLYTFLAYIVTDKGTYYSETETLYITPTTTPDISINKTTLNEDETDTGSVFDIITVTLSDGTFVADLSGLIQLINLPSGLSININRLIDTKIEISFTGTAVSHKAIDSISNAYLKIDKNAVMNSKGWTLEDDIESSLISFNFIDLTQFTDFSVDKYGHFEVAVSTGQTISERGFIYIKDINPFDVTTSGVMKSTSGSGSGFYLTDINNLEELSKYYIRAYVKINGEYYYSPSILSIDTPSIFKYRIDLDYLPTNTYQFNVSSVPVGGFRIDWGDGQIEDITTSGTKVHIYTTSGIKDITIISNKLNFNFYSNSPSVCLTEVYTALPPLNTGTSLANIFREQKYLQNIPSELFSNITNATTFSASFQGCTSLSRIPNGLFDNLIKVTNFYRTFYGCSKLEGSIPKDLFKYCTLVTNFDSTFRNCSRLSGSIPVELFMYNTKVNTFYETFYGCSSLQSIPAGLFDSNTLVTTFKGTFERCTNLYGDIPANLFDYNIKVITFEYCFASCRNLTSIPTGLFDNNILVTTFASTFEYCESISGSIPVGLFKYNTKVNSFCETFYECSEITSIPAGLFDNNTEVTSFESTFGGCAKIVNIPTGLFNNNLLVTNFSYTFSYCTSISEIPLGLFNNNVLVKDFSCTFRRCSNLTSIPEGLFSYNNNVETFKATFFFCSKLEGNAPNLWTRVNPVPIGTGCFYNTTKLSNFVSIPEEWKVYISQYNLELDEEGSDLGDAELFLPEETEEIPEYEDDIIIFNNSFEEEEEEEEFTDYTTQNDWTPQLSEWGYEIEQETTPEYTNSSEPTIIINIVDDSVIEVWK